jgi:hypothetical protein
MLTGYLSVMKKYFAGLSLLATLLFSCENIVEIDIAPQPPKIVLNGLLTPDSCFSVHVSRSQFVLDNRELESLWDARVSVYEGEKQLGVLQHQDSGYYRLKGVYPQPGKRYTLRAEYDGLEPVSATETVLFPPEDVQLEVEKFTELSFGNEEVKFSYTFRLDDPAGERNYYLFRAIERRPRTFTTPDGEFIREGISTSYRLIESPDPSLEFLYSSSSGLILGDTYFDGQPYEVEIIDSGFNLKWDESERYFSMYRISESAYLYFKSAHENYEASIDPFSEPIRVYSNVEGGYGIWLSVAGKMTQIEQ